MSDEQDHHQHHQDRLAAVEESVKEMNSMLNGADDTAILTALMSQVYNIIYEGL